jgi:hypothetical protein
METSASIEGKFRGTKVKEHLTYCHTSISRSTSWESQGVTMAGESEMAVFTDEGIGLLQAQDGVALVS